MFLSKFNKKSSYQAYWRSFEVKNSESAQNMGVSN